MSSIPARRHFTGVTVVAFSLLSLVGCAADRPELVPKSADLKTQGNERVVFVAEDAGNVWISEGADSIVYSGRLLPGDRLVIDTRRDLVTVNDRAVATKELDRRDYKVFFQPGLTVPAAARVDVDADADRADRPTGVPASASLVGEGRNRIEYTAADDGEIWIANADRNRLVYGGRVLRGEQVLIDAEDDRLDIGSRAVLAEPTDLPADNYRIYFLRSIDRTRAVVVPPAPGSDAAVARANAAAARADAAAARAAAAAATDPAARAAAAAVPTTPPVAVIARPAGIPAAAVVRSEFEDRTEVTAIDPGTAWVVDGSNRIIYSTRLQRGDKLTIDPATDLILLNGNPAYDGELGAGRYRVYFDRTSR